MKKHWKRFLIAVLALAMVIPGIIVTAELLNITSAGVDGNWVIYDGSKNIICTFDAANRKITFPSGSALNLQTGAALQKDGTAITVPAGGFTISGLKYYNAGTGTVAWGTTGFNVSSGNTTKSTTGLFYSGAVSVTTGTYFTVLGLSPGFSTPTSYNCIVSAKTAANPNVPWVCANTSTTSITVSTPSTFTGLVDYVVVGY